MSEGTDHCDVADEIRTNACLRKEIAKLTRELDELRGNVDKCLKEFAPLRKERDQLAAKVERLMEALSKLGGYAMTVRLDRKKVIDGEVMCLQMEDWCKGLLEHVETAKQALEACK